MGGLVWQSYLVEDSHGVGKRLVSFVQRAEQSINVLRVVGNGSLLKLVVTRHTGGVLSFTAHCCGAHHQDKEGSESSGKRRCRSHTYAHSSQTREFPPWLNHVLHCFCGSARTTITCCMYSVLKLEQLCLCIYMCARFHALKLEQM